MTQGFPKLLIATEFPPNASGGGPAVVRQLLKDWPSEKLFWWSCFADHDVRFGRTVNTHRVATIPRRLYPHRRGRAIKSWLMENVWTPWATRCLERTIKDIKPDVIWVIPHCWSIPPLGKALTNAEIGFHVSIHDYADINSCGFRFGKERSHEMAEVADELYTRATSRDAISESMLADLQSRTGRSGVVSRAGLEQKDFEYLKNKVQDATNQIRIAYAGTVIVDATFAIFVEALNQIRDRLPLPVTLEFFGGESYHNFPWFDSSWMRERGLLDEPSLLKELKECVWGFAPMSLFDDDPRYNRFSLPTKFISYLAAGLPVITLGHPESSVVKIAQRYKVGPCLTSTEGAVIEKELLSALGLQNPWVHFGQEIERCGRAEFDADRMRKTLYEYFSASGPR